MYTNVERAVSYVMHYIRIGTGYRTQISPDSYAYNMYIYSSSTETTLRISFGEISTHSGPNSEKLTIVFDPRKPRKTNPNFWQPDDFVIVQYYRQNQFYCSTKSFSLHKLTIIIIRFVFFKYINKVYQLTYFLFFT